MNRNLKVSWMIIPIMALLIFVGAADASAQCAPKVDNFIILVDQSGSMYMKYEKAKAVKMAVAKQILTDMNALIPQLGYKGTLDLFAPFQELQPYVVYNRADLAAAIKAIKDKQAIFGRQTPMVPGMLSAEEEAVVEKSFVQFQKDWIKKLNTEGKYGEKKRAGRQSVGE